MKKTVAFLLSLLLIIGMMTACSSGSSSSRPLGETESSQDASEDSVYNGSGRIGQTIETYFFKFKINDAYLCDDYHGYAPQSGNELLVVQIDIENLANESIPMFDVDFQAQWGEDDDESAYSFPITTDPETYEDRGTVSDKQLPYEYELGIGEKVSGELVFEVPKGYKDFSVSTRDDFEDDSQEGETYFVYFTPKHI